MAGAGRGLGWTGHVPAYHWVSGANVAGATGVVHTRSRGHVAAVLGLGGYLEVMVVGSGGDLQNGYGGDCN